MSKSIANQIEQARSYLADRLGDRRPSVVVVLGSGFSSWISTLNVSDRIAYREIPGFPETTVKGHDGNLIVTKIDGLCVLVMQGRFHYYEGHSMDTISIPIRVFSHLGVQHLIVTNAAGSINPNFKPGELMLIRDHINFTMKTPPNPIGRKDAGDPHTYSEALGQKALQSAAQLKLTLQQGTYLFTSGPSYETPAEILMMKKIGADAVGMSTVPEVLTAWQYDMEVVGVSLITNYGAGLSDTPLNHDEVVEAMSKVADQVHAFLKNLVKATKNP